MGVAGRVIGLAGRVIGVAGRTIGVAGGVIGVVGAAFGASRPPSGGGFWECGVGMGNICLHLLTTEMARRSSCPGELNLEGTGNLNTPRFAHTATLLQSGKVLVAAGRITTSDFTVSASAELYDPASGTWTFHGQSQHQTGITRDDITAKGQCPYRRGLTADSHVSAGTELYDSATGTWTATSNLHAARRA